MARLINSDKLFGRPLAPLRRARLREVNLDEETDGRSIQIIAAALNFHSLTSYEYINNICQSPTERGDINGHLAAALSDIGLSRKIKSLRFRKGLKRRSFV